MATSWFLWVRRTKPCEKREEERERLGARRFTRCILTF
jgi:hypothetical protein